MKYVLDMFDQQDAPTWSWLEIDRIVPAKKQVCLRHIVRKNGKTSRIDRWLPMQAVAMRDGKMIIDAFAWDRVTGRAGQKPSKYAAFMLITEQEKQQDARLAKEKIERQLDEEARKKWESD